MFGFSNTEKPMSILIKTRLREFSRSFSKVSAPVLLSAIVTGMAMASATIAFYVKPSYAATFKSISQKHHALADFGSVSPSKDARRLANWVAHTHDNGDADFIIVDKRNAKVYVFDASAKLRGASTVLLGAAKGDDSVPGIGSRPLSQVRPEERTTPAGRFVAERGRNLKGEDIVWVDYDAAVSMHRVRATNPTERRLQRLSSPTIADNRISYGCINVPVSFYESYVSPTVSKKRAIVYVLPETKPIERVFGLNNVGTHRQVSTTSRN